MVPTLLPGGLHLLHLCIWFSSNFEIVKLIYTLTYLVLKQTQLYSVLHSSWLLEEPCLFVLMTAIQGVLLDSVD